MTRGGARNRSGPAPDPNSGRSDRRGLSLSALPNEGYRGEAPEWPLSAMTAEDVDTSAELDIWRAAWTTPQAAAWAIESWRWPIVAEYCRLKAVVESNPAASAALVAQLHRYRDQIGLTPAGLKENGWAIAQSEILPADDSDTERPESKSTGRARDRLRSVSGGG